MIIRPTPSQLLSSVRDELKSMVVPSVSDPEVLARLGMIDSILASIAVRCDNEWIWLHEEMREIEQMAEAMTAGGDPAAVPVAAALQVFREQRSSGNDLRALHDDYNRASEVLSCALEVGILLGGELRESAERVLEARLRREVEIRGVFSLAGRQ